MPVINYAHRGASAYYPENTLWAFYEGLQMQADGIETDIQRTRDGVLVLHHDDTLERVAAKKGTISDYTYAELLKMDFGAFLDERFVGESIVTLEEFFIHFGAKRLTFSLEIKQYGVEEQALNLVNAYGCREKVIFTSFIWDSIRALRNLDREIALGYLTERITPETLDRLEAAHVGQICPRVDTVDARDMRMARERGFSVRFWGVGTEELMQRALELNGDGMTINFPDKLSAALGKSAVNR